MLSSPSEHPCDPDARRESAVVLPTPKWLPVVVLVLFCLVTAATGFRIVNDFYSSTPGVFNREDLGYFDFQNAVYYPTEAFAEGLNPFSEAYPEKYPVERGLPLFSPLNFLLHLPFSFLPLKLSAAVYFVYSLGLVMAVSLMTLRSCKVKFHWSHVVGLGTLIMMTRAGHTTMFSGYMLSLIHI